MIIKAEQKYIRMSPQKLRDVAYLAKKIKNPALLITQLEFVHKKAASPLSKVIKQAIANAKNNKGINPDSLEIREIQIGEGPRIKRFRAGTSGRVKPILKRTSHIRVVLETKEEVKGVKDGTKG
ncbi:50S ribosomal protein L22 [Candidatus Microgenomates bacterium]|nr:50S ribosomal protein L22 [Candidatus Microgenomates bacterium]